MPQAAGGAHAGEVRTRPGGLLWHTNFRLLWFGETISQLGNAMAVVVMPLLAVTVLHASTLTVSTLVAAAWLPWLLIGLPAGAWIDRLPPRAVLITCDVISAALYASIPVAAWCHVLAIGQLLAVALLGGAASVFFSTAYTVYLPTLIGPEQLTEGNAKMFGAASAARLAGPGLAGLAAQAIGAASTLIFNAVSFLASAACLLRLPPGGGVDRQKSARTIRADITDGLRMVIRDEYLRPMYLFGAAANLGLSGNAALAVVFLVRVIGVPAAAAGLLLAVPGVSGVVSALTARRLAARAGAARALLLAALAMIPFGLLIPLAGPGPRLAWYVAGTLIAATGTAVASIIVFSFKQRYAPREMLGRVSATSQVLLYATSPLGAVAAGALGNAIGVRPALWIMLTIAALSGLILLTPALTRHHDLPEQADFRRKPAVTALSARPAAGTTRWGPAPLRRSMVGMGFT
jgi:predicted MFS family arabinose efflux permease